MDNCGYNVKLCNFQCIKDALNSVLGDHNYYSCEITVTIYLLYQTYFLGMNCSRDTFEDNVLLYINGCLLRRGNIIGKPLFKRM